LFLVSFILVLSFFFLPPFSRLLPSRALCFPSPLGTFFFPLNIMTRSSPACSRKKRKKLQPGVEDRHIFSIGPDGMYSAKSAYNGLFMGSVSFGHYTRVWKTWAPPKCRFFIWLAAHNRCWTADRLANKGLNHPEKCLLCDQAEETLDHLLVTRSFSRVFWYQFFRKFGLHSLAPQPTITSFLNWWEEVLEVVSGVTRKGLNSLIILGAWTIWIHRNKCVFDGLSPCLTYKELLTKGR
jgi:hypothetical protein